MPQPVDTGCSKRPPQRSRSPFVGIIPSSMTADPSFAGYPLLESLGPCPGGVAFLSNHPLDGRPVVVRRLAPAAVGDSAVFIQRGRAAQAVAYPYLARLVDVGEAEGEPFAVLEPLVGASLATLVGEIGPMPAGLAAGFALQLAGALAAAHTVGLTHGNLTAERVVVGPLEPIPGTARHRPALHATATLLDLGLVPSGSIAGDLRGLGETLYLMLVGHLPASADQPLAVLRPDASPELRAVVNDLLLVDPTLRPSAETVANRLVPTAVVEVAVPASSADSVSRSSQLLWLAIGAALNLLGVGLFAYYLSR